MFFEIFSIFLQILQHHNTRPAQKPHIDVLFGHLSAFEVNEKPPRKERFTECRSKNRRTPKTECAQKAWRIYFFFLETIITAALAANSTGTAATAIPVLGLALSLSVGVLVLSAATLSELSLSSAISSARFSAVTI